MKNRSAPFSTLAVAMPFVKSLARGFLGLDWRIHVFVVCAVAFIMLLAIHALSPQARYNVTDLGTLGGKESTATAINNSGQVVGQADTGNDREHAFIWQAGKGIKDLGTLGGETSSAMGINDIGQVVGRADTDNGKNHAFLWQDERGMQDLSTLGGSGCWASGINDVGQVVGSACTPNDQFRAFLWQVSRGIQDLQIKKETGSEANAINNKGQIVGENYASGLCWHAFIWQIGKGITDIGTLGGDDSSAQGINDAGQVVGCADTPNSGSHAFLWQVGRGMQDLGALSGNPRHGDNVTQGRFGSKACGINNKGQIVGGSDPGNRTQKLDDNHDIIFDIGFRGVTRRSYHAFLYSNDVMIDLNKLIDRKLGWNICSANAINDSGQIAADGANKDGNYHALLITPVQKGRSSLAFCFGIIAMYTMALHLRSKMRW